MHAFQKQGFDRFLKRELGLAIFLGGIGRLQFRCCCPLSVCFAVSPPNLAWGHPTPRGGNIIEKEEEGKRDKTRVQSQAAKKTRKSRQQKDSPSIFRKAFLFEFMVGKSSPSAHTLISSIAGEYCLLPLVRMSFSAGNLVLLYCSSFFFAWLLAIPLFFLSSFFLSSFTLHPPLPSLPSLFCLYQAYSMCAQKICCGPVEKLSPQNINFKNSFSMISHQKVFK